MARHSQFAHSRPLAPHELLAHLRSSIETIRQLAKIFDQGHPPAAFLIATEIMKVLVENSAAVRARGKIIFLSWATEENDDNILPQNSLIYMSAKTDPPDARYEPNFLTNDRPHDLNFREWWSRETIWRAGAAPPGMRNDMFPVNGSPSVPFAQRERLTRMSFTKLVRDKLGAHVEKDMPHLLDELQSSRGWGVNVVLQTPQGPLRTADGSLPITVTPAAAIMRQIAHEVLISYDRAQSSAD